MGDTQKFTYDREQVLRICNTILYRDDNTGFAKFKYLM